MNRDKLRKLRREALFLGTLVLVVLAARSTLADHVHVPSGSMRPTLEVGDHVLIYKAAYGLRLPFSNTYLTDVDGPERGDVVVLDSPEDGEQLIKRIVAVPGDKVEIRAGRLRLDDRLVPVVDTPFGLVERLDGKPHYVRLTRGGGTDLVVTTIPEDHYLVVGDNRGESHDGRGFGLVERSAILGRAEAVFIRDGWFVWRSL